MKTTRIQILFLSTAIAFLAGCATQQKHGYTAETQCVTPPPSTTEQDKTNAWKLSAKLDKLQVSGDLEANFSKIAKDGYQQLSDANTTLLILINGANCLMQRPEPLSKAAADKLIDAATKLALGKLGVAAGFTGHLTADQVQAFLQLPNGQPRPGGRAVIESIQNFGITVPSGM